MIEKAGTILINKRMIGLIYRDNYDDYTFPKGHLEKGETLKECAIRETNEETKREVIILKEEPIYVDDYTDSKGNRCVCTYYLARDNGPSDNDSEDTHELVWTPFEEVGNILSYNYPKVMWHDIKDEVAEYLEEE